MKSLLGTIAKITGIEAREIRPFEAGDHDPWAWHQAPDTSDEIAVLTWTAIEHLRAILHAEGWPLGNVAGTLVVMAEPPFNQKRLKSLRTAVQGLHACWDALEPHVGCFPAVAPEQSRDVLTRIEFCHDEDGFEVCGWDGLQCPQGWPVEVAMNLTPIYTMALWTEGGAQ